MNYDKINIENLKLNHDKIIIYQINFSKYYHCIDELKNLLNSSERVKAGKFYFEKDQNHFIIGRGLLRRVLSLYLNISPGAINFLYNDFGKPFLLGEKTLKFNISHSNDMLLIAISPNLELGVDVEFIRNEFASRTVANQFFSAFEIASLNKLKNNEFVEGFYNCWTRKESFIKCIGNGLSIPLDSFDVTLIPDKRTELVDLRINGLNKENYLLFNFNINDDKYKAAICVESSGLITEIIKVDNLYN